MSQEMTTGLLVVLYVVIPIWLALKYHALLRLSGTWVQAAAAVAPVVAVGVDVVSTKRQAWTGPILFIAALLPVLAASAPGILGSAALALAAVAHRGPHAALMGTMAVVSAIVQTRLERAVQRGSRTQQGQLMHATKIAQGRKW